MVNLGLFYIFSQEEFSIKNEVRCGTTFRLHIFQNEWLGVSGDEYRTVNNHESC